MVKDGFVHVQISFRSGRSEAVSPYFKNAPDAYSRAAEPGRRINASPAGIFNTPTGKLRIVGSGRQRMAVWATYLSTIAKPERPSTFSGICLGASSDQNGSQLVTVNALVTVNPLVTVKPLDTVSPLALL